MANQQIENATLALEHSKYVQQWFQIAAAILTPIAIAALTFFVSRAISDREASYKRSEQVLELKQKAYAEIGPDLNKIYVYIDDVGDFASYTPMDILRYKRDADRKFYMYQTFWSDKTISAYHKFMEDAFRTYTGTGKPAMIRSLTFEKEASFLNTQRKWNLAWNEMFTTERADTVGSSYRSLVQLFILDITSGKTRDLNETATQ